MDRLAIGASALNEEQEELALSTSIVDVPALRHAND